MIEAVLLIEFAGCRFYTGKKLPFFALLMYTGITRMRIEKQCERYLVLVNKLQRKPCMLELMRKRRSIRKFKKERMAQTTIDDLKEAVLRSPSSRGNRPWQFFFLQDAELITSLSRCKESGSAFLKGAPLAVVVCGDETVSDVWIEDCSIAAIVLHLAAESLGLGSCWIQIRNRKYNAESTSEDYVRNVLGIAPPIRVLAIIAIGLPDEVKAGHLYESLDHGKIYPGKA
jgi:nitroreductase